MMNSPYVIIMAGGVGSRFWPYSKEAHPKQFLDILGIGKTLLQMTYDRFAAFVPTENIFIATNERYDDLVKIQLPQLTPDQILLEPSKNDTAPCIAYACYKIASQNPEAVIIITPADHAIFNEVAFQTAIQTACNAADNEKLITIGIQPNRPAVGYGYIKFESTSQEIKKVQNFTEKPNKKVAQAFLDTGDYVWNAGVFVWSTKAIKKAFKEHLPKIDNLFKQLTPSFYQPEERDVIKREYPLCEEISIDYGVLEKSDNVYVVLGDFGWTDLGSWASLHDYGKQDESGNITRGEVMIYDVKKSFILGQEGKIIVVQGLENHVVVDTEQSLLICEKDNETILKQAIADLKNQKKNKFL